MPAGFSMLKNPAGRPTELLPQPAEAIMSHGPRKSAPRKAQPEVPFYPPPVIIAPQNG